MIIHQGKRFKNKILQIVRRESHIAVQVKWIALGMGMISLGFLIHRGAFQNQVHHGDTGDTEGIAYDPIPPQAGLDHKPYPFGNRIKDVLSRSDTG
jgi:hypothetical protein